MGQLVKEESRNRLIVGSGGASYKVVGVVFWVLAIGLGVMASLVKGTPVMLFIAALILAAFGLVIFLYSKRITFDKNSRNIRIETSALGKKTEEAIPFDDIEKVELDIRVVRSGKSTNIYYVVYVNKSDDDRLEVVTSSDKLAARVAAEKLAKALRKDLVDPTSGTVVVRKSDELDESLKSRLKRKNVRIDCPARSDAIKATSVNEGRSRYVRLAPRGIVGMDFVWIVLVAMILAPFCFMYLAAGIALSVVFLVAILGNALLVAEHIMVDNKELQVVKRVGSVALSSTTFKIDDIEELELLAPSAKALMAHIDEQLAGLCNEETPSGWVNKDGIVITSDSKQIRIGGRQPPADLCYAYAFLMNQLSD